MLNEIIRFKAEIEAHDEQGEKTRFPVVRSILGGVLMGAEALGYDRQTRWEIIRLGAEVGLRIPQTSPYRWENEICFSVPEDFAPEGFFEPNICFQRLS